MCAGAIVQARLPRLVFGATDPKAGACVSLYSIVTDGRLNHQVEVIGGVMELECATILKEFFEGKRSHNMARSPPMPRASRAERSRHTPEL